MCYYFLANFWKAAFCFEDQPPAVARRVIDAGSGSGATAFAYLAWLESHVAQCPWKIEVVLIDRSSAQIRLARQLFEQLRSQFRRLNLTLKLQQLDLEAWKPNENEVDLILFGHVLTENRSHIQSFLEKALRATEDNGMIYIIEDIDDDVWHILERSVRRLALPVSEGVIKNQTLRLRQFQTVPQKSHPGGRYAVLRIPYHKQEAELLRLYFCAWEKRSVDLLDRIFAPNAKYYVRPYEQPLQGIEQIKKYWVEKVLPQRDIEINILHVAYNDKHAFCEWQSRFRLATQEVELKGVLILEFSHNVEFVATLREYYQNGNRIEGVV